MKAYKKMVILVSGLAMIGLTGCPAPASIERLSYCGSISRASTPGGTPAPLVDASGTVTYTAKFTFQWTEDGVVHKAPLSAEVVGGVACASAPFDATLKGKDLDVKTVSVTVTDSSGGTLGSAVETDGHGGLNSDETVYSRSGNFVLPAGSSPTPNPSNPNVGGTPTTNGAVSRILKFFSPDKVATQAPVTDSKAKLLHESNSAEEQHSSNANAAI